MAVPIVKVFNAQGEIVHDCVTAECASSWDGYSLADGTPLEGRTDPGKAWDVSKPGEARLKPPPQ